MTGRRPLLIAAAASLIAPAALAGPAPETMGLWPGSPPGGGGPLGPEHVSQDGAVSRVARPCMHIHRPDRPNGAAVLVAAGGGYRRIEMGKEAHPAALWLTARGITAFMLVYRLPGEGWVDGPMAPLQDAQRAIRLIRARAASHGLNPARVGALGFSAGGHLMGLAAAWSDFRTYAPVDSVDFLSARPDDAALIYPIVTLEPPYQHSAARVALVGHHPSPQASAEWSVQTHVRHGCPPIFLAQAKDDPISNPANAVIMDQACLRADVPVEFHQLPTGGHGFGMGRPGGPTGAWPGWYRAWLARHDMAVS
ncbi:alpha/beta hydrolase [Acidocella sp.]|uniref:alpha/beta hydrolase n=1 Tax=Acidocella sp. TaxID=50710 RepID=UPI003D02F892